MKEITKQQEENVLLYSIYTIMYLNDTACNGIKELKPYIKDKDKESQKIFNALYKRANNYFASVNKVVGAKEDYYAEFCAEMDEINYQPLLNFKNTLYDTYKEYNLDDCEYYTQVETMRAMIDLAVIGAKRIVEQANKRTNANWLNYYTLTDIQRVANNFATWAYRKIPKDVVIDFSIDSYVIQQFSKVSEAMMDYNSFCKAYTAATLYENEKQK